VADLCSNGWRQTGTARTKHPREDSNLRHRSIRDEHSGLSESAAFSQNRLDLTDIWNPEGVAVPGGLHNVTCRGIGGR